jgi:Fe-S-cluster containining protein
MKCRPGCGACCIAQSISSPIPGMPDGKPAGVRCVQLSENNLCMLYGDPRRPQVCIDFQAMPDVCGSSREEAMRLLEAMERETAPHTRVGDEGRTTDDK